MDIPIWTFSHLVMIKNRSSINLPNFWPEVFESPNRLPCYSSLRLPGPVREGRQKASEYFTINTGTAGKQADTNLSWDTVLQYDSASVTTAKAPTRRRRTQHKAPTAEVSFQPSFVNCGSSIWTDRASKQRVWQRDWNYHLIWGYFEKEGNVLLFFRLLWTLHLSDDNTTILHILFHKASYYHPVLISYGCRK